MPPVECLGVHAVHLPHPNGEVSFRCLYENMVMIIHKAIGVTYPVVPFVHMVKKFQKILPVLFIHEDGSPFVASAGNVIDRSRVFYS
jgi:hypothetical protein